MRVCVKWVKGCSAVALGAVVYAKKLMVCSSDCEMLQARVKFHIFLSLQDLQLCALDPAPSKRHKY
jgi:hypothetical protein